LKLLEDNVEQSLLREEEALNVGDDNKPYSPDTTLLQKALKEQKSKYEVCCTFFSAYNILSPMAGRAREGARALDRSRMYFAKYFLNQLTFVNSSSLRKSTN
jgi:hypothetical protein